MTSSPPSPAAPADDAAQAKPTDDKPTDNKSEQTPPADGETRFLVGVSRIGDRI